MPELAKIAATEPKEKRRESPRLKHWWERAFCTASQAEFLGLTVSEYRAQLKTLKQK